MVRSRVSKVLKKIPAGSKVVGGREIITSTATQTLDWKRPEVVHEEQKVMFHDVLRHNKHLIDPKTGELILRSDITLCFNRFYMVTKQS